MTVEMSFDYDAGAGFAKLDTYDWLPEPTAVSTEPGTYDGERVQAWVTDAVDAKLIQKGFRKDGNAPDFLVSYDTPDGMHGSLTLVFVSPDSQQLIWRGKADDTGYPARNADAMEIRVRTAVGVLFEQFPPLHDQ